jgi:hypothetical protein
MVIPATYIKTVDFVSDLFTVGNAKIDGMLTDIGIKNAAAYNTALALYFVSIPDTSILLYLNFYFSWDTCFLKSLLTLCKHQARIG